MADGRREEIYLSGRELGQYIDTPVRTIENWAAAGKIQQDDTGKYGLISAYKYQLEKLSLDLGRVKLQLAETKEKLEQSKDKLSKDATVARNRKAIAEADKEEQLARIKKMEADQLEGILIDAEEVLNSWKNAIANVKAKFINMPAKLALELSGLDKPEDIQARLTVVIDEALIELGESE